MKWTLVHYRTKPEHADENQRLSAAVFDELLDKAQRYTGIKEKSALLDEALRFLVAREAGRRLAAMGGTEPDFVAKQFELAVCRVRTRSAACGEQTSNRTRVDLIVGIEHEDVLVGRDRKTRVAGLGNAIVMRVRDQHCPREPVAVLPHPVAHPLLRAVAGAVVNDNKFKILIGLPENGGQRFLDVCAVIERRHED